MVSNLILEIYFFCTINLNIYKFKIQLKHLGSHGKETVNKVKPTTINDGAVWFVGVGVKCRQHVRNGGYSES